MSAAPAETRSEAGLVRALGVIGLAASIVNITIGGGIFRLPGSQEVTGRLGAAAPLSYALCAIAMAFVVMCFAEAGSRVSLTGGIYAYVERAFGGAAGFAVGWLVWMTATIATAAVATIFADNVQRMVPALSGHPFRAVIMIAVLAVAAAINVRGVQLGARLNVVSTVAKLAPLALLIVVGMFSVEPANLRWTETPAVGEVTRASMFLLFAFAGIESALVPSGEVKDPARTVPRSVFLALGVVTVVYVLVQIVAQGILGSSLVGRAAPLADAAEVAMGPYGALLLSLAVVVSTFGYLCGMTLAVPRALFAFARDGVLPKALAGVHERFHTPWLAIIVQTIIAAALALTNEFERLALVANVSVLIAYLGCAAAAWQLRRTGVRDAGAALTKPIPGSMFAAPLAAVVIVFLLTAITVREWIVTGSVAAVGMVFYGLASLRRGKAEHPAA